MERNDIEASINAAYAEKKFGDFKNGNVRSEQDIVGGG